MKEVVIVGAAHTPIGCFQGALASRSAVELGSLVIEALLARTGVSAQEVDEAIIGQVLTAGAGQKFGTADRAEWWPAVRRLRYHH